MFLHSRYKPAANPLAFANPLDQTGLTQHPQVVRHVRLGGLHDPHEITDALLSAEQGLHDPKPSVVPNQPEHLGALLRGQTNSSHSATPA